MKSKAMLFVTVGCVPPQGSVCNAMKSAFKMWIPVSAVIKSWWQLLSVLFTFCTVCAHVCKWPVECNCSCLFLEQLFYVKSLETILGILCWHLKVCFSFVCPQATNSLHRTFMVCTTRQTHRCCKKEILGLLNTLDVCKHALSIVCTSCLLTIYSHFSDWHTHTCTQYAACPEVALA